MKIYTKTGDAGETSLIGGTRVLKSHLRIESYGTVDELNSMLGVIASHDVNADIRSSLEGIQNTLFVIGAQLASDASRSKMSIPNFESGDIDALEQQIDVMDNNLPPLKNFILPGGNPQAAFCHLARCVCRRAERAVIALSQTEQVDVTIIAYLNRLSDYLFVLARKLCSDAGIDEIIWKSR